MARGKLFGLLVVTSLIVSCLHIGECSNGNNMSFIQVTHFRVLYLLHYNEPSLLVCE